MIRLRTILALSVISVVTAVAIVGLSGVAGAVSHPAARGVAARGLRGASAQSLVGAVFDAQSQPLAPATAPLVAAAEQAASAYAESPEPPGTLDAAGIQEAYSNGGIVSGVFPTSTGVCFVALLSTNSSDSVWACRTVADAEAYGFSVGEQSATKRVFVGILPNGASVATLEYANGSSAPLEVNAENAYAITGGPQISGVSFHAAGSTTPTTTLLPPEPSQAALTSGD